MSRNSRKGAGKLLFGGFIDMVVVSAGKFIFRGRVNQQNKIKVMGDKSPKSAQKKASQKQSKANDSNKAKQALITSQQATKAKAAANKKK